MKKLMVIMLTALCLKANALYFTIVNQSFDEATPTERGSQQYLDVKPGGSYLVTDSIEISIADLNNANVVRVFTTAYWSYFPNLPMNQDGSRRVFFNMPANYPDGTFKIILLNAVDEPKGFFETITGITPYQFNNIKTTPTYYNLTGQIINPQTTGIYIRTVGTKREKVFLMID